MSYAGQMARGDEGREKGRIVPPRDWWSQRLLSVRPWEAEVQPSSPWAGGSRHARETLGLTALIGELASWKQRDQGKTAK